MGLHRETYWLHHFQCVGVCDSVALTESGMCYMDSGEWSGNIFLPTGFNLLCRNFMVVGKVWDLYLV